MRRITYIYQQDDWPNFRWNIEELVPTLSKVRNLQGLLTGRMEALGINLKNEALLETLSQDVLKTSEIEGEILDKEQVRSSLARRLGIEIAGLVESDRNVDGVVEIPTGWSGMYKIKVGDWREDAGGPMQVVSGAMGKEKVHFEAPPSDSVSLEMKKFINWINEESLEDLVIKSGIAHLWFLTIHPFEDGNGRIARAITDLFLSKSEMTKQRFYSLSAQIRMERKEYYALLEKTQKGSLDITEWLAWFLNCLHNALKSSEKILGKVLFKHSFWKENNSKGINERQKKILNKMLDGFTGKLTSSKWAKINKCSKDTAIRDIQDLIKKNILVQDASGGRSTTYSLKSRRNL